MPYAISLDGKTCRAIDSEVDLREGETFSTDIPEGFINNSIILTPEQFWDLFTEQELIAIYTSAESHVALKLAIEKIKFYGRVVMDSQEVRENINNLVLLGILTQVRAKEILTP